MNSSEKIARILRVDKDVIKDLEQKAEGLTGKKYVIDKIVEENEFLIKRSLQLKNLETVVLAEEIYQALINKLREDGLQLFKALGRPSFLLPEEISMVLKKIQELVPPFEGYFLKKEKAAELLRRQPPIKVIDYLKYRNVEELLEREDIFEIFSAIRLFEDQAWFNEVLAKEYLHLTPADFEWRKIEMRSLSQKWAGVAQVFLKKKYQNISHLKELGFIFVVPTGLEMLGDIIRMFSLALHYFYEVKFYSELSEHFFRSPKTFGQNLVSAVRVDILDEHLPENEKSRWLILPSYLARKDENDWRLFAPHVSTEALFWKKAEETLMNVNKIFKEINVDFSFWRDLDWVGDYFKTQIGLEVLVSFSLVDTTVSLVKGKELVKYLYHNQESLWNKIFTEYFGEEKMEALMKENLIGGWFDL